MASKIFFSVLVIALIVVAAFFFFRSSIENLAGNAILGTKEKVVAYVDDMPVTQREIESAKEYIEAQTGKAVNQTEALKRVVSEKLILEDAQKHGFTQTIEDTKKEISKILATQNQTLSDFQNKVEFQGSDYEEELESYRQQFLINKYLNQEIAKPNVTDAQVFAFYNENKNKFSTHGTIIPYEQISQQLKLTIAKKESQDEITAYLAKLHENATIVYLNK